MNGSRITHKTGSEGPRHDPYHYDEYTLTRSDGRKSTVHLGLAQWMTYFDGRVTRRFDDPYPVIASKFEAVMGISLKSAAHIPRQLYDRKLRKHHKHDTQWVKGYPGEELLYCNTCGTVIDSCFNWSVIE